jgi:UDP-N-acetylmuramate dehydrogenase
MIFLRNFSLQPYNTFHIHCKAKYWLEVNHISDLEKVATTDVFQNQPHLILGGGSNLLFTKDFQGLVLKINLKGIKVIQEDSESVWLECCSGENWHEVVSFAVQNHGVELKT